MMQISDLAERAGVTTRTIRYYEELGMIRPQKRTKGGFRLYADEQLHSLLVIQNMKSLGLDLDHIQALFNLKHEARKGKDLAVSTLEMLEEQQSEIDKKIGDYRRMKEDNRKVIEILRECADCTAQGFEREGRKCALYRYHPGVPDGVTCSRIKRAREADKP